MLSILQYIINNNERISGISQVHSIIHKESIDEHVTFDIRSIVEFNNSLSTRGNDNHHQRVLKHLNSKTLWLYVNTSLKLLQLVHRRVGKLLVSICTTAAVPLQYQTAKRNKQYLSKTFEPCNQRRYSYTYTRPTRGLYPLHRHCDFGWWTSSTYDNGVI